MSVEAAPRGRRGSSRGGRGSSRGSFRNYSGSKSIAQNEEASEDDEARQLRLKFKDSLAALSGIFPDWSEQDLLFTLKDSGDLETAVARISEGHAQQWDSVKSKKSKPIQKSTAEPLANNATSLVSSPTPSNPSFTSTRGSGRGRGESRGGRGALSARGGRGRGGRGGSSFSNRSEIPVIDQSLDVNGDSTPADWPSSTTNNSNVDAASTTATAGEQETPTPSQASGVWSGWGSTNHAAVASAKPNPTKPKQSVSVAAAPVQEPGAQSGWGEEPFAVASNDQATGWGDEAKTVSQATAQSANLDNSTTQAVSEEKAIDVKAQPISKPTTKRPAGSTMSWAQIARPAEPPKPVAPAVQAAPPAPSVHVKEASSTASERPRLQQDAYPQEIPEPVKQRVADPWAATPAAAVVSNFPSQPLGVGEGWAETVLANNQVDEVSANQQAFHHNAGSPNLRNAIPPEGVDPAGPIEYSNEQQASREPIQSQSDESLEQPQTDLSNLSNKPVVAQLEDQAEASLHHPQQQKDSRPYGQINGSVPPGLDQPQMPTRQEISGYPSIAPQQMSHTHQPQQHSGSVDRMGVQFGSFGLFDHGAASQQQAQQQQSTEKPPLKSRSPEGVDERSGHNYGQATSGAPLQNQNVAHAGSNGPYAGYPQFNVPQTHTPSHQQPFASAYLQHYQAQAPNGNLNVHAAQRTADTSPFPAYQQNHSNAQLQNSNQGQAQREQSQQIPASYAAFHSVQAPQHQGNQYSQNDYSHLYNMQTQQQDNSRSMMSQYGAYGNYSGHDSAQTSYAGRPGTNALEDKQQSASPAAGLSQPSSAMNQHANAPYPGYNYPYNYYGGYGQPPYGSAPNYQQNYAAYQYGQNPLQGLGGRPAAYQQQPIGRMPAPAAYSQQAYYQNYQQQSQAGQDRDRGSYKSSGFSSDF